MDRETISLLVNGAARFMEQGANWKDCSVWAEPQENTWIFYRMPREFGTHANDPYSVLVGYGHDCGLYKREGDWD